MSEALTNNVKKSDTPSDYAKLYFKKPKKEDFDAASVFDNAFPFSKYMSELHFNEETNQFLNTRKTIGDKIAAGGECAMYAFGGLTGGLLGFTMLFLNKLPEHTFEKTLKPMTIAFYGLCFLAGYFAYRSANNYNKNLDKLSSLYSQADKKDKQNADKEIKAIINNKDLKGGIEFINNYEKNKRLERIIARLEKANNEFYLKEQNK